MIETLSSRIVYENRWLRLREDAIRRPDGTEGIYAVVDKSEGALIVPWDGERMHLVGQERYTVGAFSWEFPQGAVEGQAGLSPEDVARTELREELGLRAGRMRHLGHLWFAVGMSSQGCNVWLATDLERGEARPEAEEVDMHHRAVTPDELAAMLRGGEIQDNATFAAWAMLELRGVRP